MQRLAFVILACGLAGVACSGSEPEVETRLSAEQALAELHPSAQSALRWMRGEANTPCPAETRERGSRPPRGFEIGCEAGGMPHGPFASWHLNGEPASAGLYREGQRQGEWLRFNESGGLEATVSWRSGVRHGVSREFDASGYLVEEVRWEDGSPAS